MKNEKIYFVSMSYKFLISYCTICFGFSSNTNFHVCASTSFNTFGYSEESRMSNALYSGQIMCSRKK